MWASFLFAALLVAVSAGLLAWHAISWKATRRNPAIRDLPFYYRQYRRRMFTSALIGMAGVLIAAGAWVRTPLAAAAFWTGVVLLVMGMLVLAVLDGLDSRAHYRRLLRQRRRARQSMEREIEQMRRQDDAEE